jgi:hypothetical protein
MLFKKRPLFACGVRAGLPPPVCGFDLRNESFLGRATLVQTMLRGLDGNLLTMMFHNDVFFLKKNVSMTQCDCCRDGWHIVSMTIS